MKEFCVDLEIGEQLEKNDFPESIYGWYKPNYDGKDRKPELLEVLARGKSKSSFNNLTYYRLTYAPFSDEIIKELPSNFIYEGDHFWLTIIKDNENNYQAYYEKTIEDGFKSKMLFRIIDKKLSNCLSLTWLYLKKEGYIK